MSRISPSRDPVSPALRRRVLRAIRDEPNASPGARLRPRLASRWVLLALVVVAPAALYVARGGSNEQMVAATLGPARVRIDGDRADLVIDRLPALPPNRTYELWLQTTATRLPVPSTLFSVTARGSADLGVPGATSRLRRVLVTVEPVGGSRRPTTRPVIVAPLA